MPRFQVGAWKEGGVGFWLIMGDHCYLLVRKFLRFILIKSGFMSLTKSEHGNITDPEKIPEAATLRWLHAPTLARSTLDNASRAEANRLPSTILRGT